jgi:hypothetical protein
MLLLLLLFLLSPGEVSKFTYKAPIGAFLCRGGPSLRHNVVCLAQLEHHFSYRFRSHWRQIDESFIKDFDIQKKLTLRKYSNFRREVGKASVGDPSIICARHWATSKQNLIGLNLCISARHIFSVAQFEPICT